MPVAIIGKWKWKIAGIAGLLLAIACGFMWLRLDTVTLQRDMAAAGRVVAEESLKAYRRISGAVTGALNTARKEDEERHEFSTDTKIIIEQSRGTADDLPLTDTQRAFYERMRSRYEERQRLHRDP